MVVVVAVVVDAIQVVPVMVVALVVVAMVVIVAAVVVVGVMVAMAIKFITEWRFIAVVAVAKEASKFMILVSTCIILIIDVHINYQAIGYWCSPRGQYWADCQYMKEVE